MESGIAEISGSKPGSMLERRAANQRSHGRRCSHESKCRQVMLWPTSRFVSSGKLRATETDHEPQRYPRESACLCPSSRQRRARSGYAPPGGQLNRAGVSNRQQRHHSGGQHPVGGAVAQKRLGARLEIVFALAFNPKNRQALNRRCLIQSHLPPVAGKKLAQQDSAGHSAVSPEITLVPRGIGQFVEG